MKRKELEELKALHQEIETLEHRYLNTPRTEAVGDTYSDYSHGFKQIRVLQGVSTKKSEAIKNRLEHKCEALLLRVEAMEAWLDSVEDSEMRDILRLYYANDLSQEEVARQKGYTRSGIATKLERFWRKCDTNDKNKRV